MTPLQAAIFLYRFGLNHGDTMKHSLEETGIKFGMSRERIRQQEMMFLEGLRALATKRGESGIERTTRERQERRARGLP